MNHCENENTQASKWQQRGFEPRFPQLRVRHSIAELPRSMYPARLYDALHFTSGVRLTLMLILTLSPPSPSHHPLLYNCPSYGFIQERTLCSTFSDDVCSGRCCGKPNEGAECSRNAQQHCHCILQRQRWTSSWLRHELRQQLASKVRAELMTIPSLSHIMNLAK